MSGGVYMRTVATMETIVPKSWATMGLEDTKQIEVQAEMAQSNGLIVGGTLSVHKNIDKYSWTSPDKRTRNQIDHFLITLRLQKSELNCQIHDKCRQQGNVPYDGNKLNDREIRLQLALKLTNRSEVLSPLNDEDQETAFTVITQTFSDTTNKHLVAEKNMDLRRVLESDWNLESGLKPEEAEEADRRGDSHSVYCITNEIVGKRSRMRLEDSLLTMTK
ncbi:hypothetical protein QYM36_011407 [Artemia franciscana]|uniref:Uncharacterized protein n=1 Tax=Artemia franciscana TaxID=6661 RepID=A0AA88KYW2_ARTSF|nr:hypothetical protein QYM36_011407 [Artemia franciscana]